MTDIEEFDEAGEDGEVDTYHAWDCADDGEVRA
jgi:hypothetical protein